MIITLSALEDPLGADARSSESTLTPTENHHLDHLLHRHHL